MLATPTVGSRRVSTADDQDLHHWRALSVRHLKTYSTDDSCSEAPSNYSLAPPASARRQLSPIDSNSSELSYRAGGGSNTKKKCAKVHVPRVFHILLNRLVPFVHYPTNFPPSPPQHPTEMYQHCPNLFFGQVKFDICVELMRWVIYVLTEGTIHPVHLHPRGAGCFMVYFASHSEAQLMERYSESVLFDDCGVWIARSGNERDILRHHAAEMGAKLQGVRLPKGCMVIRP